MQRFVQTALQLEPYCDTVPGVACSATLESSIEHHPHFADAFELYPLHSKLAVLGEGVGSFGKDSNAAPIAAANLQYSGKAPGTDTTVAVTADPDGYTTVLVEYSDFAKELHL